MTAEQKQRAADLLAAWRATAYALHADRMADLLQELVDAPEAEPVARVTGYYAGYLSIAPVDGLVLPTGTALYTAPTAPSVPDVARDAALYCAAQRACAELPEGWEIRIELERSAGTVILVNPDGDDVDYSSDHEYMASDINAAIDAAIEREILRGAYE